MLVRFDQISPYGNHYEVRGIEGLESQQDFIVKGPLVAQCTLKRKGDDKVEMLGQLKTCLSLACDRCLAFYDIEVDAELQILFETASSVSGRSQEVECNVSDLDSIVLDEPVVDLDDVLRQQLYLALPMKSLCSEQCKGICSGCGVNLNQAECSCEYTNENSPFAVLALLKKKNTKK